jgi:hypothetical protein
MNGLWNFSLESVEPHYQFLKKQQKHEISHSNLNKGLKKSLQPTHLGE